MAMKNRRSILKTLAALTAGLLVPSKGISSDLFSPGDRIGELLPLRLLGKTGEKVTMLGLGVHMLLGVTKKQQKH